MTLHENAAPYTRPMDRARIGQLVQARRKQLRLTLERVAESIGQTRGNVSHIEHGTYSTSIDTLAAIGRALGSRWEVRFVPAELPERAPLRQQLVDKMDAIADLMDERDARILLAQLEVYEAELPSQRQANK